MAITAAVAAVASVVVGAGSAILANSARNKATKVQGKLNALKTSQAKRAAIQEKRRLRAASLNVSHQTGGIGSSGESGSLGSLQSQGAANTSFLDASLGLNDTIVAHQNRAQKTAAIGGAAASALGTVSTAAGNKDIQKLFKS